MRRMANLKCVRGEDDDEKVRSTDKGVCGVCGHERELPSRDVSRPLLALPV